MPKKTKKMKARAAARIHSGLGMKRPDQQTSGSSKQSLSSISPAENNALSNNHHVEKNDVQITNYFKTDLRKSILLILCVITLEIIFYFASMNTGLAKLFTIK
ncbi:MAG: hypothetical protein WC489_02410 [Patescibacteria group bacterium]